MSRRWRKRRNYKGLRKGPCLGIGNIWAGLKGETVKKGYTYSYNAQDHAVTIGLNGKDTQILEEKAQKGATNANPALTDILKITLSIGFGHQ
jgi:hypothetical protein